MSNPMSVEVRTDFAMARGNHFMESTKFTMAILFGTAVVLAFASPSVLDGPLCYVLTALIIGAFLFGALGGDGCIKDFKSTMLDMTPEEQETNIGKNFKAQPFGFFSLLLFIVYVGIGLTQLIMLYS